MGTNLVVSFSSPKSDNYERSRAYVTIGHSYIQCVLFVHSCELICDFFETITISINQRLRHKNPFSQQLLELSLFWSGFLCKFCGSVILFILHDYICCAELGAIKWNYKTQTLQGAKKKGTGRMGKCISAFFLKKSEIQDYLLRGILGESESDL